MIHAGTESNLPQVLWEFKGNESGEAQNCREGLSEMGRRSEVDRRAP